MHASELSGAGRVWRGGGGERRPPMQHVVRAFSGVAHIILAPACKTRSLKCNPVEKEERKNASQGIGGPSEGRRR